MKKVLPMILAIVMILSCTVVAFAEVGGTITKSADNGVAATAPMLSPTCMYGSIIKVDKDSVEVKEHSSDKTIVLHISDKTYFIDAVKGIPLANNLKVGDSVAAYYGPAATFSLPPQSSAVAIISNIPQDKGFPFYIKAEAVEKVKDDVKITASNGSMIVTLTKGMDITPFKTKNVVNINDVTVGSELVVWYDIVAQSYPGQATATKAVLLSVGDKMPAVDKDKIVISKKVGVISVGGKELEYKDNFCYEKNGVTMLPVRILAEALGYDVTWLADMKAVEVRQDAKSATMRIGSTDYGVNKMRLVLKNPPEMKAGKTYVPADFFEKALEVEVVINNDEV